MGKGCYVNLQSSANESKETRDQTAASSDEVAETEVEADVDEEVEKAERPQSQAVADRLEGKCLNEYGREVDGGHSQG